MREATVSMRRWSTVLVTVLAMVGAACQYTPSDFDGNPDLSRCLGQPATIGIGWHEPSDGPRGSSYVGTEGDDVVVITNGPVRFDGLGGDDLICVNDTGMASGTRPIRIDAGDGDDVVQDRRFLHTPAPSEVVLRVDLGAGADAFYGSAARDKVDAGAGDDELNGGGGADDLDCGSGIDVSWTGDFAHPDTHSDDCEHIPTGHGPVDETGVFDRLDLFVQQAGVPGSQIGLRVPGQPDLFAAAGHDDPYSDPRVPMPTDGTFPAASITKTLTSAVILQLIDEGQLGFDDTLDQWLPDYPHGEGITVRMLLEHTAGLISDIKDIDLGTIGGVIFGQPDGADHAFDLEELIQVGIDFGPPPGPPPQPHHYTNLGYHALGYIIEQVTGQTFSDVVAGRILDPLGLDDSTLADGSTPITQKSWWDGPDVDFFSVLAQKPFMTYMTAVGNLVTTTEDLLDWGEALYSGQFLSPTLHNQLRTMNPTPGAAVGDSYGLGVKGWCPCDDTTDPPTPSVIGHDGWFPQATVTRVAHEVDTGVTIAFRANNGAFDAEYDNSLVADLFDLATAP